MEEKPISLDGGSEFNQDKAKVAEDRVAYRKHMKEHAKVSF